MELLMYFFGFFLWDFYNPTQKTDSVIPYITQENYKEYSKKALDESKKLYIWIEYEPILYTDGYHLRAKLPIWNVTEPILMVGTPVNGVLLRTDIKCPT